MEAKLKHLEFIQGVINRMASNSFQLKGWIVVLVSALLVLGVREDRSELVFISVLPVLVFWALDAYFLRQERLYRALYGHVRTLEPADINFSMDTSTFRCRRLAWPAAVFSKTLIFFYGAVAIAVFVAILIS